MKSQLILAAILGGLACASAVAQQTSEWNRLDGVYQIYGGSLGDRTEPTAKDRKVMFSLSGSAARDLFNAIGPDRKDLCTEGTGTRVRKKDHENLVCMRTKQGEYSCNFGFDLLSGKSIGGSIC